MYMHVCKRYTAALIYCKVFTLYTSSCSVSTLPTCILILPMVGITPSILRRRRCVVGDVANSVSIFSRIPGSRVNMRTVEQYGMPRPYVQRAIIKYTSCRLHKYYTGVGE